MFYETAGTLKLILFAPKYILQGRRKVWKFDGDQV